MEFLALLWNEIVTRPMTNSLMLLYVYLGANLGLAIIVFTLVVRGLSYPLVVRQLRQMRRMQELQPRIKAVNDRYKDDPQRRGQEVMKVYKEVGVNPVGCLGPMIIQMPIFIGLFWAIEYVLPFTPENLAGLANRLYSWLPGVQNAVPINPQILGMNLALETLRSGSIIGFVLVALSGVTMFVQQKMSQVASADPSQQAQQRMMTLMFPVMFGMFSLFFPIGLVIYWVTSNLVGIVMQYFVSGWGGLRRQPELAGPRLGPTLSTTPTRRGAVPPAKEHKGDAATESGADGQDSGRGDRAGGARARRRPRRSRNRRS